MYHKVYPTSPTEWWVEVDQFYRQMWELQSRHVVYLDDYNSGNPDHVVITFDGVYSNVRTFAAPILKKFGYPFELFVAGNHIGGDNSFDSGEPHARFAAHPELVELENIGGRLQWHTRSHPDLARLESDESIEAEMAVPGFLARSHPKGFGWLAYPYGSHTSSTIAVARRHFRGAVSCVQGSDDDRYRLNRITVTNATSFARGRIACVIASYNYGGYLVEAVESVLRQTIRPREIVITDDHSDDNTREIAEEFVRRHPTLIRYNRNEHNLGIVENFNRAVTLTDSEYVVILGADNRLASNYFEACAAILERDPEVGIVYTHYDLFGPRARMMYEAYSTDRRGRITDDTFYRVLAPVGDIRDPDVLRTTNFIHGTSMYRRSAFNQVGGYAERGVRPEDHDLFHRILKAGYSAQQCPDTTLYYRQHSHTQANVRLMSYTTLLHYIEKSRRLERELALAESSLWRKLFYPMRVSGRRVGQFQRTVRREGLWHALAKAWRKLGWRRPEVVGGAD